MTSKASRIELPSPETRHFQRKEIMEDFSGFRVFSIVDDCTQAVKRRIRGGTPKKE